jgi:hypothetical protein
MSDRSDRLKPLREFLKGEAQTNAFNVVALVVGPVLTAGVIAVWTALKGNSGPFIALAGLGGFVLFLLAVLLLQRIRISKAWQTRLRSIASVIWLVAVLAVLQWIVGLASTNANLNEQLDKANGHIRGLEQRITTLQAQLDDREERKRLIGALGEIGGRLRVLRGQCAAIPHNEYEKDALQIISSGMKILSDAGRGSEAMELSDGKLPPGGKFYGGVECGENLDVFNGIRARIDALDEIVGRLSR